MQSALIPLFPLNTVLLPGARLPLHIFEERYKEMIALILSQQSEFGVVLAAEGGIAGVGCTAKVDQVARKYPDGRLDIIATGVRRFRVRELDSEESYLRGHVEYFGDSDLADPSRSLRIDVMTKARQAFPEAELDSEARNFSFQVGQESESLELRQTLLGMLSERERLQHLSDVLPGLIERQRLQERMQKLAPRNGHGKHLEHGRRQDGRD